VIQGVEVIQERRCLSLDYLDTLDILDHLMMFASSPRSRHACGPRR